MRQSATAAVTYLTALEMQHGLSRKGVAKRKARMPISLDDSIMISGLLARAQQSACILTRSTSP